MKTKMNLQLKKKGLFLAMLLSLSISKPVFSQEIEVTDFSGICPDGLIYNPATDYCEWDPLSTEIGTVTRFKTPRTINQSTTFKIRGTSITFSVSSYDLYECSLDGRDERCGCSAVGTWYLFQGYKRYSLC